MSDKSDFKRNIHRLVFITQDTNSNSGLLSTNLILKYDPKLLFSTITDADFCLFKDFPFHQMIIFALDGYFKYYEEISCTKIWLEKHADQLIELDTSTINSFEVLTHKPYKKIV